MHRSRRTRLFSQSNTSRRTGPWEPEEDERLLTLVSELGTKHWKLIGIRHGLRDGKQCRERWHNHLNPDLIYSPLTPEEDEQILTYHSEMGTKWAVMSQLLRRPANLIKNRYYSSLSKKRDRSTSDSPEDDSCSRSRKRIKEIHTATSNFEKQEYKKSSKELLNNNKISRTLNNQTNYHKEYLDLPKASAWSPCSDDSAYFEPSMTQEPVSLLTPVYTPVTSPGPSFCTALEQLADLAIKRIEKTSRNDTKKHDIMSISAVLN
ncbi:unnamed protein product [Rhizophagus irregularis]|uniref:Homeodomain-like protein n=2 Tax=Rhizophagus irregularis TaxID=588596 RepID=A0A915ZQR5_9GLOM|nr:homeodomain-like protein [Rhizophagus irregularis DAOM 181602=DAOM 197198]CAB4474882.1 unnamed protein product [Rhizophagus irregularis]CAB5198535.1 unnamed protein product [Rhizophagus irregularis]CAB5386550.1 unnamed protein product [Rhizophagus irregularis]